MTGLAASLLHVHSCGILHRDVTQSNCILCYTQPLLTLKLSDFGASAVLCRQEDQNAIGLIESGCRTTFRYAAPEVLRGQPYGLPSDIWSAGIILYEILQVDPRAPAVAGTSNNPADYIAPQQALLSAVLEYGAKSKSGAMNLACRTLHQEPDRRPATKSFHQDHWLASGQSSDTGLAGRAGACSGARLPEDAPEIWKSLSSWTCILELVSPSDIVEFRSSISKLGPHRNNMLLHYILGIAKYPFAVQMLSVEFSSMPLNFKAMDLIKACHKVVRQCARLNNNEKAGHCKRHIFEFLA